MAETEKQEKKKGITRRGFLKYASASAGLAAATLALSKTVASTLPTAPAATRHHFLQGHPEGVAAARQVEEGMDPMQFLKAFYRGTYDPVTKQRTFELTSAPQPIEVARGVQFPAWAFLGPPPYGPTVPGPTLRCSEGDIVSINFHNGDEHPHTIHLHGIHPGDADGVFEILKPGENYSYQFTADPFGLFLYHCHVMSVKKHIAKGLYGAFIVDPVTNPGPGPLTGQPLTRPPAREMVMVMNGFDADFDDENEFYTVNGIANYYLEHPIPIHVGELVRIYLVNLTEFDPVNSFHLHGNMFRLYRTGTRFDPTATFASTNPLLSMDDRIKQWLYLDDSAEITDTVFLGQGERAILEFIPKEIHRGGRFLFHAHQSEFIELGWTGLFKVVP